VLVRAARAWRRIPGLAAVAISAALVQALFSAGFAYSLKLFIEDLSGESSTPSLHTLIAVLLAGFVLTALATVFGERATARAAASIGNEIRRNLYRRLARVSPSYLVATPIGNILSRFGTSLKGVEVGFTQSFLGAVVVVFSFLVTLPLLFLLEWPLALITAVLLPVVILVGYRLMPKTVVANQRLSDADARIVSAVQEIVQAHQVVRAFRLESMFGTRFDELVAAQEQEAVRARTTLAAVGKGVSLAVLLVQVIVVSLGALFASYGKLSAGSLVAFVTIVGVLARNVYEFSRADLPALAEAGRGISRVEQLLAAPVASSDAPGAAALSPAKGRIAFENVTFGYTSEIPAVQDVSFDIPAGTSVALVGTNGSGKSTILNLLMRFYDPQSGRITIDGCDLREATQESVRAQMAAVFQQNFLFADSIEANIRVGNPAAAVDDVVDAARLADLHDYVLGLPDGYQTHVGETGGRLSGGVRQRLAIGRALIGDPPILILDEVATALDPATESAINAMLRELGKGRTVISATHRLAAVAESDWILVMDRGRLVQQGTHDELVGQAGAYRTLWEKQSGFEISRSGRHGRVQPSRLRQVELFADLEDDALEQIALELESEYHEAGETIFEQGDPGDRFYIVARGRVQVLAVRPDGEKPIQTLDDGDHFGEIALMRDQPRTATIRTLVPCMFLTMSRDDFLALVERTPSMSRLLEARMASRLEHWAGETVALS